LDQVLRIRGSRYSDYWFAEDAILKVRLAPQALTLLAIVVLVLLTALFGIVGVITGALTAVLLYFVGGWIANGRRDRVSGLTVKEAQGLGLVTLRIPYSVVSQVEMTATHLAISVEGRTLRVRVSEDASQRLQSLLREKLSDRFSASV
jgi:hypothetical protein